MVVAVGVDNDWSSSPVVPPVAKLGSGASEDVGAGSNHVVGPGELLAVENQGVPVLGEAVLAVSALLLQSLDPVFLVFNFLVVVVDFIVVPADFVVIVFNVIDVLVNVVFQSVDVVVEVDQSLSQGFEGNHHFSFGLHSLLVLALLPDWLPLVEVVNVVPEVSGWNVSVELGGVVVESVSRFVVVDSSHWLVVVDLVVVSVMVVVVVIRAVVVVVMDNDWFVVAVSVAGVLVVDHALVVVVDNHVRVLSIVVDLSALDGWLGWSDGVGLGLHDDWLWGVPVVELGIVGAEIEVARGRGNDEGSSERCEGFHCLSKLMIYRGCLLQPFKTKV